ncbi:iron complex transport system substrate-binding protein [Dietzia kunjamensis subsp. schimae]|uniref:Iron complex transport system substrate-binding protein n=1 Tax=Dietzia kunjamensis subsp. schimae TaxID=498198 RepID=A0ABY1N1B7_9ACTN|nr:iron-siderophore ABC transporter substrate-binding protein [Dietzia kunjamensis]MBB1015587.1 iron-siderophore ABC transporter substrate-binding protein [Dietzia kunjamensis subsp. schimae]SMO67728.1 iron complex transport system substrate-binding protein [Dietzia kunjamensis subsp. schimae]
MTRISRRRRSVPALIAMALASAVALSACSGSSDTAEASSDDSYTVTHAMGETVIDGTPERVVVLDSPHLDALVALGHTPVGITESGAGTGAPPYLGDVDADIVGLTSEPDIDAIAALAPDLIIGAKVRHEAIYDELSGIAPTVYSENSGTDWQEQARITAAAVGEDDEMEQLIDDLDTRIAEVGEQVGAEGTTLSIVRFRPDNFRLYGPETFSGSILSQMGFDLGEREWNEYSMAELSPELYEQIAGDVVFFTNPGGDPSATTMATVTGLWGDLPAVKSGQTYEVEDETWMVGIGVLGAGEILDDVQEILG